MPPSSPPARTGKPLVLAQRRELRLALTAGLLVLGQVLLTRGPIGYDVWAGIFAAQWMKVITFTVIFALIYHVWVGMRDIWMDYIKPVKLRLTLHVFTIIWLLCCLGWAVQVLWRF